MTNARSQLLQNWNFIIGITIQSVQTATVNTIFINASTSPNVSTFVV